MRIDCIGFPNGLIALLGKKDTQRFIGGYFLVGLFLPMEEKNDLRRSNVISQLSKPLPRFYAVDHELHKRVRRG
jgi:hypothetical protein